MTSNHHVHSNASHRPLLSLYKALSKTGGMWDAALYHLAMPEAGSHQC